MSKITNFGRTEHRLLSARMAALLAPLEAEFGVKIKAAGGSFAHTNGIVKIAVEVQDTGNGLSAAESEFRQYAALFGLKPEWFGATFYVDGTQYRLSGVNPGAPKYPLKAQRVHDSRDFKMTTGMVKTAISAEIAKGKIAA